MTGCGRQPRSAGGRGGGQACNAPALSPPSASPMSSWAAEHAWVRAQSSGRLLSAYWVTLRCYFDRTPHVLALLATVEGRLAELGQLRRTA